MNIFHPIYPILLYLFLAITTLHEQSHFLLNIHIESLAFTYTIISTVAYVFIKKRERISYTHPFIQALLMGLVFIIAPIITSFFTTSTTTLYTDEEYLTLTKMILFLPCLFWLLTQDKLKNIVLNFILISYFTLGVYFIYRYKILNEVRDFDLRPQLKIRHGDANFLCTFFSMMIPLALLQAWRSWNNKRFTQTIIHTFAGIFFLLCTLMTESRMGILATFLGLAYLLTRPIWPISKTLIIMFIISLSIILAGLNGDRILQRFGHMEDKSNSDRILTWKNGWIIYKENPIFGIGIHNAKNFFYQNTQYPPFQSEFKELDIHNTFLKVLAELGIVGFIFFLNIFLWPWIKSISMSSFERYFLLCSLGILTLSIMTIGIAYKDLFILHLILITGLSRTSTKDYILA